MHAPKRIDHVGNAFSIQIESHFIRPESRIADKGYLSVARKGIKAVLNFFQWNCMPFVGIFGCCSLGCGSRTCIGKIDIVLVPIFPELGSR